MLRIYFLQQWYGLADEALVDTLCDSRALRGFAGIELNRDPLLQREFAASADIKLTLMGRLLQPPRDM
jgi:IS5 family transposase